MSGLYVEGEFAEDRPVCRKDGTEVDGFREVLVDVGRKHPMRVAYFIEDADGETNAFVPAWLDWQSRHVSGDKVTLRVRAAARGMGERTFVNFSLLGVVGD